MSGISKKQNGFTIVELLIVIVVIGILAAITVVAYNGVQQRAQNTKTSQALGSWIKALQLYKTENGGWMANTSCLGSDYLYGPDGTDTTGTAQCRMLSTGVVKVSPTFVAAMAPFVGSTGPMPTLVTAKQSDTSWWRGLTYVYGGGSDATQIYIHAAYAGKLTECPTVGGFSGVATIYGANTQCYYLLGSRSDS